MSCLFNFSSPQLHRIHSGKVRESFRVDDETRLIVVTDRLSAFDSVLRTPIPHKGAVLNSLSNFWFEKTRRIVDNHVVRVIDPNITLVREAEPIRLEMIVRGYLTGSMWRRYKKGKRNFCGLKIPNGLRKNERFPVPILTPTTKGETDEDISPTEAFQQGLVARETYQQMEQASLRLFKQASALLEKRGLILVDTKYEFGLIDGKVVLIDELHTPDSSRFWFLEEYEEDRMQVEQLDKEFVRVWLMNARKKGRFPDTLPDDIVEETSERYLRLFELVTGHALEVSTESIRSRIWRTLVSEGLISEGFIAIVMGSAADLAHCERIKAAVEDYGIAVEMRVVSAHKTPSDVAALAREYNESIEPGAVIAVAGLSNGLGGALAANMTLPVFNCPPFKNGTDMMLNINSSLMMPSRTPAATVMRPGNAAMAALRSLNLPGLKERFSREIAEMQEELRQADRNIRGGR